VSFLFPCSMHEFFPLSSPLGSTQLEPPKILSPLRYRQSCVSRYGGLPGPLSDLTTFRTFTKRPAFLSPAVRLSLNSHHEFSRIDGVSLKPSVNVRSAFSYSLSFHEPFSPSTSGFDTSFPFFRALWSLSRRLFFQGLVTRVPPLSDGVPSRLFLVEGALPSTPPLSVRTGFPLFSFPFVFSDKIAALVARFSERSTLTPVPVPNRVVCFSLVSKSLSLILSGGKREGLSPAVRSSLFSAVSPPSPPFKPLMRLAFPSPPYCNEPVPSFFSLSGLSLLLRFSGEVCLSSTRPWRSSPLSTFLSTLLL